MKSRIHSAVLALFAVLLLSISARASSLLAYLPLNGNLNDISGNGNNGVVPAGDDAPIFDSGRTPGTSAAVFSGTDAKQLFQIPINLNNLDQVTFGAWIEANALTLSTLSSEIRGIISDDTGSFGRTIDLDTRGLVGYAGFDGSSPFGPDNPPSKGAFDFVAISYNHTAGTEFLDVNGSITTATGTPPNGETVITVGRNPNFDNPFGGTIADLFVFGTALTADQLANIEANGVQVTPVVPLPSAAPTAAALLVLIAGATWCRRKFRTA